MSPREPAPLKAQADELRLRVIEQRVYLQTLTAKGKPKEALALKAIRIDILEDAANTLERLAASQPPDPPKAVTKPARKPDPDDDY